MELSSNEESGPLFVRSGISSLNPDSDPRRTTRFANAKLALGFEPKGLSTGAEKGGAVSRLAGTQRSAGDLRSQATRYTLYSTRPRPRRPSATKTLWLSHA